MLSMVEAGNKAVAPLAGARIEISLMALSGMVASSRPPRGGAN